MSKGRLITVTVDPVVYDACVVYANKADSKLPRFIRFVITDWVKHALGSAPEVPLFWRDLDAPPPDPAAAFVRWLQNPRLDIHLTPGEEVLQLRQQVRELQLQTEKLQAAMQRAQDLYGQECVINLELEDLLRSHGIRRRR